MSSTPLDLARRSRAAVYVILALVATLPVLDVLALAWPMHPGQIVWRFGAVGMLAGTAASPLVGLLLILAFATYVGDRWAVWLVVALAGLGALLCLTGFGALALDALQMRGQVRAQTLERFTIASIWSLAKLLMAALASLLLFMASLRSARGTRAVAKGAAVRTAPIVIGHQLKGSPEAVAH